MKLTGNNESPPAGRPLRIVLVSCTIKSVLNQFIALASSIFEGYGTQ